MKTFQVPNTDYWRQGVRESIRRLRLWGHEGTYILDSPMAEKEWRDLLTTRENELELMNSLGEGATIVLVKVGGDDDED